jgi:5-methylcytosine-specific restriction protein A
MGKGFNSATHGTAESRGYGSAWKKLRLQILKRDNYLCQVAAAEGRVEPAHEVDHIISKAKWLELHGSLHGVDDPSNLQAINRDRHKIKSMQERGHSPRSGFDADGKPTDPTHHWNR